MGKGQEEWRWADIGGKEREGRGLSELGIVGQWARGIGSCVAACEQGAAHACKEVWGPECTVPTIAERYRGPSLLLASWAMACNSSL